MSDRSNNFERADERAYFTARAETEHRRAEAAADERVRHVHQQLAEEYADRARRGAAND